MALGGGVDAELPHGIHWRLIQMDYVLPVPSFVVSGKRLHRMPAGPL